MELKEAFNIDSAKMGFSAKQLEVIAGSLGQEIGRLRAEIVIHEQNNENMRNRIERLESDIEGIVKSRWWKLRKKYLDLKKGYLFSDKHFKRDLQ